MARRGPGKDFSGLEPRALHTQDPSLCETGMAEELWVAAVLFSCGLSLLGAFAPFLTGPQIS